MNNWFFTILMAFMFAPMAYGQQTITLTEDLVLTETLVINESTNYNGNGFSIICEGCNPMIMVQGGIDVNFVDVKFRRGYERWLSHEGVGGTVTWSYTDSPAGGSTSWSENE
ncbi:MAG: hypothetical protein AAFU67_17500 [Bacteroidota bacterium]